MCTRFLRQSVGLVLACAALQAAAQSAPSLKLGVAHIGFNTRSGDLAGPPGTTPPGVQAGVDDSRTLALVAEWPLSERWGLVAQLGTPPVLRFHGAGSGAALGPVGSARAWFPAVLASYKPAFGGAWQPYAAAGLNLTFFNDTAVSAGYTAAFGGSASRAKLERSVGPVFKLGTELRLGERWLLDLAWARYGIETTATLTTTTPGLGEVARTVDVKADPDVFSLLLGRRF
jgi:outer membrane protein